MSRLSPEPRVPTIQASVLPLGRAFPELSTHAGAAPVTVLALDRDLRGSFCSCTTVRGPTARGGQRDEVHRRGLHGLPIFRSRVPEDRCAEGKQFDPDELRKHFQEYLKRTIFEA